MFLNSMLLDKVVFMNDGIRVISTFSLTKSVNKGMVTKILCEKYMLRTISDELREEEGFLFIYLPWLHLRFTTIGDSAKVCHN